jgi:DNA-binding CsgD family transcriptional regulator
MTETQSLELFGRDEEIGTISRFLAGGPRRALLLEGDPGMGKTSVWRAAVALAREQGCRTLVARPIKAERELSFAVLSDLVSELLGGELDELPAQQRRAFDIALLRAEPEGPMPDQRAVGMALLTLLRRLAAASPLVVAIDDLQWLDPPSTIALGFALRRLETEPARILATLRTGAELPLQLEDAERVPLGPLSLGALGRLLETRLGNRFSRPTLIRIAHTAGGNPLYTLELGRALAARTRALEPDEPLPVPADLRQLLRRRLGHLSRTTRLALATAAALARPTPGVVSEAIGSPTWEGEALEAGVLEEGGDELRFSHPLLAEVALAALPTVARRRLHRRLAECVDDVESRARHLAAASAGPDRAVLKALDAAVRSARARGAPEAAADLAEQGLRLTPPEDRDELHRWRLVAARHHRDAGALSRARELLEEALLAATSPVERAEAKLALADVLGGTDAAAQAELLASAAHDARGLDVPALRGQIELELATLELYESSAPGTHLQAALSLAEQAGDEHLRARAIALAGFSDLRRSGSADERALRWAAAVEESRDEVWQLSPVRTLAVVLIAHDRFDEARLVLERWLDRMRRAGSPLVELAHLMLGALELRAGSWAAAAAHAEQAHEIALMVGDDSGECDYFRLAAAVEGHRGETAAARSKLARAVAAAERVGLAESNKLMCFQVLGFVELSDGDPAAAAEQFAAAHPLRDVLDSSDLPLPDEVEALLAVGRIEEAEAETAWYEQRARRFPRPWTTAAAMRCRGLVEAAAGNTTSGLGLLEQAAAAHEPLPRPFQLGRALLALGVVARRARKKRLAREALERALACFDELGSPLWADRARGELARIGGRPASADRLTPTERRIAELVAEGRSNLEVARLLFVSPKTVEWNLSKVYRKLYVRSRTELAAKLARRG